MYIYGLSTSRNSLLRAGVMGPPYYMGLEELTYAQVSEKPRRKQPQRLGSTGQPGLETLSISKRPFTLGCSGREGREGSEAKTKRIHVRRVNGRGEVYLLCYSTSIAHAISAYMMGLRSRYTRIGVYVRDI